MKGKHLLKTATAAVLSLAIVFSVSAGTVPAKAASMDDLRSKQSSLKQQQKQYESQIAKLKDDRTKQEQYKNTLDSQIKGLEALIDNEQEQIDTLNAGILKKQQEISAKEAEIKADFERLKQRVYALYLTGEASNLEIVLNAKNIMDLADKTELLRVISKHDNDLMDELQSNISSIQKQKDQIESDRKDATAKKTDLDANRSALAAKSNEVQKVITSIAANQSQTETAKANVEKEYQATTQELNQAVAQYQAVQQKLKEQQQRQQQNIGGGSGGGSGAGIGGGTGGGTGGVTPHGGKFAWPVPGFMNITSGYGPRDYNGGQFHYGIDIASDGIYGKKIVAAASGVVVVSDDEEEHGVFGGYGNVVVIEFSPNMVIVCGHMCQRAVSYGDTVSAGETIGYVGSTGDSTGAHLHFEVRQNYPARFTNKNGTTTLGTPVNPGPYLGI